MRGWDLLSGPVNMPSQEKGKYMLIHKVNGKNRLVCDGHPLNATVCFILPCMNSRSIINFSSIMSTNYKY